MFNCNSLHHLANNTCCSYEKNSKTSHKPTIQHSYINIKMYNQKENIAL